MEIIENSSKLNVILDSIRLKDSKIGLIPTMGSIHEGHISLIEESKKLNIFSLVTIFVNPTQFNNIDDYKTYPKNREKDIELLSKKKTDLLFFPSIKDLYPKGIKKEKTIFQHRNILCDNYRPGHFDGVTTVVKSLFELIKPDHAFFGEKDFQQLKIIKKIVEEFSLQILIHGCPSIRMKNCMSFSSRYARFINSQKNIFNNAAKLIMKSNSKLKKNIDLSIIKNLRQELIMNGVNKIDYIEVRDEINLLPTLNNNNARLFLAFYIDDIRIVDNFILY